MADEIKDIGAVLYTQQALNEDQKAQARSNIGASAAIVETVTGEVVVVNDSSDQNLQGLTLYGKTTQDGTPTPNAPIDLVSAGDGGNIGVNVYGKNYALTSSANKPINMGAGSLTVSAKQLESTLKAGQTYTLTADISCENPDKVYLVQDTSFTTLGYFRNDGRQSLTFTVGANDYAGLYLYGGKDLATSKLYAATFENITVCEGEPQTLTVSTPNGLPGIPVTSGGNYTDQKGQQWVCDEVDLIRGVYVRRLTRRVFSSATEVHTHSATGNKYATIPAIGTLESSPVMSNRYGWNTNMVNNNCYIALSTLIVCDNRFTDLATANAILAEEKPEFIYALNIPIETPLADMPDISTLHTHYPNTTVMADGVGVAVTYVADTKNYIDNKIAALSAALLNA